MELYVSNLNFFTGCSRCHAASCRCECREDPWIKWELGRWQWCVFTYQCVCGVSLTWRTRFYYIYSSVRSQVLCFWYYP